MSMYVAVVFLLVLVFAFLYWDQQKEKRKARTSAAEWREIALAAHANSMEMEKNLTTYVINLEKMSIQDQIIVGNIRLEQYALKLEQHDQKIVRMRAQDAARGYAMVEIEIEDGGTGDGYEAG